MVLEEVKHKSIPTSEILKGEIMDTINITILEDGAVTVKIDAVSDGNHISADELLEEFENLLGGTVKREKSPDKHRHNFVDKKALAK